MWSYSYCLLPRVTLGKELNFSSHLYIGNNTSYLKSWPFVLNHQRQLSHIVTLLKVLLLMSRERLGHKSWERLDTGAEVLICAHLAP